MEGSRKRKASAADQKKKKASLVQSLQNFGGSDFSFSADFSGTFLDNLDVFLQNYAKKETPQMWSIKFKAQDTALLPMFIFQQMVLSSAPPHCDHCKKMGWNNDLVPLYKYHFIIPSQEELISLCKVGLQAMATLETKSQMLHGMIHSNGYGHLISLNGRELQTAAHATGTQLMDLWDRICSMLKVRKMSVRDDAKKSSMEWRLIHSIAYGSSWFSRWGFNFGRGSYGITRATYLEALESLRALPFAALISLSDQSIPIFSLYQKLSGFNLQTAADLLRFMLDLRARLPAHQVSLDTIMAFNQNTTKKPVRWPPRRVEYAIKVVIEALKKGNGNWISRLQLRDIARVFVGDTGLVDFVLKSMGNCVVGEHVVLRAANPITKIFEYRLEDVNSMHRMNKMSPRKVIRDIAYIYTRLMEMPNLASWVRIILDTRNFVKDYDRVGSILQHHGHEKLQIVCRSYVDDNMYADVVIAMPSHATFGDLKVVAQRTFSQTYLATRHFHLESISNLHVQDEDLLIPFLECGSLVVLYGTGIDVSKEKTSNKFVNEVDCLCGVKDDDGERFVMCSICNTLQHTHCVGILDIEEVPELFVCNQCSLEDLNFI